MVRLGGSSQPAAVDGDENRSSFKSDVERLQQTRRVYRAAQDLTNKLESILRHKQAYRAVFEKDAIEMRMRLRDLCERLMFLHPVDFGRKAEEILWWKVYYNVINLMKRSKKHLRTGSTLECAYRTHLLAATGFYHHLLMRLQWEYGLQEDHAMDFMSFPDEDQIGGTCADASNPQAKDWAQKACHRCLIYLGDLARYRQDYEGPSSRLLAERFYHQALIMNPAMGMPHNQLGTLAGIKYQGLDAAYHYMRCWLSDLRFDGAIANLEKVFERNQKRYLELPTSPSPDLPPELQRPRDIKHFLIRFLYLQEQFQPSNKSPTDSLAPLCQEVLQSFHQCMLHGATKSWGMHLPMGAEDGRESCLSDDLVFKLVTLTVMSTYRLQKAGSKQTSTAVVFTLALFSYTLNHLCERLNNAVYRKMYPEQTSDPTVKGQGRTQSDGSSDGRASPANTITPANSQDVDSDGTVKPAKKHQKKKPKNVLKSMRRRRKRAGLGGAHTSEDSDLSEGEPRSSSHSNASSESGEGSDDQLGVGSDSDYFMDSQELELEDEDVEKQHTNEESESPPPITGQDPDMTVVSDKIVEDMSSQLIAPSTQTPPGRRSIRLAPSFDAYAKDRSHQAKGGDEPGKGSGVGGVAVTTQTTSVQTDDGKPTDSGGMESTESTASPTDHMTSDVPLSCIMEVLTNEGLLPVVKILTDWLRTNEDVIIKTAQSSQPLWARLASLLNLCPQEKHIINQEWCSSSSLKQLLEASLGSNDSRNWHQPLPVTEDVAVWRMPPLQILQKKMKRDITHDIDLTLQDEAIVRVICLRQFGFYLTTIHGISLVYSPDLCLFTSPTPEAQESLEDNESPDTGDNKDGQKEDEKGEVVEDKGSQDKTDENEERRQQVMREMAQLRLQSEVSQLEGSIEPLTDDTLSPYLIPDTGVLTNQLSIVRALTAAARFIFIIPKAVISHLDVNKKHQAKAREAIKFMEREFQIGNRYLRAQKEAESAAFGDKTKVKTDDKNTRTFCSIAECAHFFALHGGVNQSEVSSPNLGGMVTILTDHKSTDNPIIHATLEKVTRAGIDVTTAQDFLAKWKAQS